MLHSLKDQAITQVFKELLKLKSDTRTAGLPKCIAYPSSPSSPFITFIPGQLSPGLVGATGSASEEISGSMYLLI
jgi:hypothetical protein